MPPSGPQTDGSTGMPATRYGAIEAWVRDLCRNLPAGAMLPSELDLAEEFGVSRMTARQAMQNLAQQGLVERRRGAGTFVAPTPLRREEQVLYSFTQDMRRRGLRPSSTVLAAAIIESAAGATAVGSGGDDRRVVQIIRVRYADGIPLAHERALLPLAYKQILDADLTHGSVYASLTALGHRPASAATTVHAQLATPDQCAALGLEAPVALLVETRTVYESNRQILGYFETAYVGARWVIDSGVAHAPGSNSRQTAGGSGTIGSSNKEYEDDYAFSRTVTGGFETADARGAHRPASYRDADRDVPDLS